MVEQMPALTHLVAVVAQVQQELLEVRLVEQAVQA
jgi:hypothetical protein